MPVQNKGSERSEVLLQNPHTRSLSSPECEGFVIPTGVGGRDGKNLIRHEDRVIPAGAGPSSP